jgi:hypothetical protein
MPELAEKLVRGRLLRTMAVIAVVVPATVFAAGCAQEPPPPPQPIAAEAPAPPPPPAPAPAPAPAPMYGQRG